MLHTHEVTGSSPVAPTIASAELLDEIRLSPFALIALLLTTTAVLFYFSYRFIPLPPSVGLMGLSLTLSLLLVAAGELGMPLKTWSAQVLTQVNFSRTLLNGMLSFLLFAGSLHVNMEQLKDHKGAIAALAAGATLISTVLVAALSWLVFGWMGLGMPFIACLIFGALISPTDPISVLGLLKAANAPQALSTKIAGESLFNDGVGIILFLLVFRLLPGGLHGLPWRQVLVLALTETAGGIALGLALGGICFLLLISVDHFHLEVMLTLAMVSGGYELAELLHTSGPIAIVTAGIFIGNYGRRLAMSERSRENLDNFWELLDEILNAVLFVLIGLQVLLLDLKLVYVIAAAAAVPVVLACRLISVAIPAGLIHLAKQGNLNVVFLTWGGLRGGISIALALTLPFGRERDILLVVTYGVVAFSILAQAPTTPWLIRRTLRQVDV